MLPELKRLDSSVAIATVVSLCATALFAVTALRVIPTLITGDVAHLAIAHPLVGPLILCIALVLLSWRRAADLRKMRVSESAAREKEFSLSYTDDVTGLRNRRYM